MVEQIVGQKLIDRQQLVLLPFPMNISRLRGTTPAMTPGRPRLCGFPPGSARCRYRTLNGEILSIACRSSSRTPPAITRNSRSPARFRQSRGSTSGRSRSWRPTRATSCSSRSSSPSMRRTCRSSLPRATRCTSILTTRLHPGRPRLSTYPLDSGNQRRSYGFEGGTTRRQFANGSAQGIYNAAVILLNYDEAGAFRYTAGVSPHLPAKPS